jgi:hypothetical protein
MKHLQVVFAVVFGLLLSLNVLAQSTSREGLRKAIEAKRAELEALEQQFLAPSESDRELFANFLTQPDTGLIRLLPREKYDSEVYKKNAKTLTMRGGGAYYSFARLTHEYGYGSDLALDSGYLSVGFAGANYGMLLNIGDISLDEISSTHPAVRFLSGYTAATTEPEARVEYRRFGEGTEIDGSIYKSRVPLETNKTYLVRSIDFSTSDVLVAFHVVRTDDDGSAIIAWKLLKKYSVPSIAKTKRAEDQKSFIR